MKDALVGTPPVPFVVPISHSRVLLRDQFHDSALWSVCVLLQDIELLSDS